MDDDEWHESYGLFVAVGFALDVFLIFALGFILGRCSTVFF